MSKSKHSWKSCRPGERLVFGTIIHTKRSSPKSRFGEITVKGHRHVGVYHVNLDSVEKILGRPARAGDGWSLYVTDDLHPQRLYIGAKKIHPVKEVGRSWLIPIVLKIVEMYIPYSPQPSFDFIHPWERSGHLRENQFVSDPP